MVDSNNDDAGDAVGADLGYRGPYQWSGLGYNSDYWGWRGWEGRYAGLGPRNYRRSDARIADDVNEYLTRNADLDATDIDVSVDDGEVTLSGLVDDRGAKRLAEDIVESVSGVRDVHNALRARRGLRTRDDSSGDADVHASD